MEFVGEGRKQRAEGRGQRTEETCEFRQDSLTKHKLNPLLSCSHPFAPKTSPNSSFLLQSVSPSFSSCTHEDRPFAVMGTPLPREWVGLQQFPAATQTVLFELLGKLKMSIL
ncbi:hypothetical protein V6N13_020709 [Hibiscus sabdariffa]